ncbi:MAG: protein kinase [Candidatus Zixiibacteriota bacterium]
MIGQTISHYTITAKLGEGGMGEVYLATDTNLDRQVAIKFLSAGRSTDPEARQRFIHEAKAQAMLSHPHIATFLDVGEADGRAFLIMEYVEGRSLPELARDEKLTLSEILDLVIQVAEGLQAAHEHGIVHRDIKPENVLVTSKRLVKITDFGLARWKGATTLTKKGTRMGTAYYMSPEQTEGRRVDHRGDIFSLGVILYELVCRQRPFEGETETAIAYAVVTETPEPLARYKTGVPEQLQSIVSKCLAKDPAQRYQSAADLVTDLTALRRTLTGAGRVTSTRIVAARRPWKLALAVVVGVAVVAAAGALVTRYLLPSGRSVLPERKMLAVLPFENLGSSDDEYFSDGITDEITAKLAVIRDLGVISRTSTMQYKNTTKKLREVARELGVDYVLEGTIRWDKSRDTSMVRVVPQLIRVSDDTHLWAETYQRPLTDIFALQADIASRIAEAMDVTLVGSEHAALEAMPTRNLEAYQAYLRGSDLLWGPDLTREDCQLAVQMFQRAVQLDSTFALAYAKLANVHTRIYRVGGDATPERLGLAKAAVDRALALQPRLPWAHIALSYYYYWGLRDYDAALRELSTAEVGLPNDPDILSARAFIWRRQGQLRDAVQQLQRAFVLNPRSVWLPQDISLTERYLRDYAPAIKSMDQSIALAPDQVSGYVAKSQIFCFWRGDTSSARATLASSPNQDDDYTRFGWLWLYWLGRDYPAALGQMARLSSRPLPLEDEGVMPKTLLRAMVYDLMSEPARARGCYDSARVILEDELKERPDDHRVHGALGLAYAGLDRKQEAIQEGKLGTEILPVSRDAMTGPLRVADLAQIYIMVGEYDQALDQIEYLLSIPSLVSVSLLRLDPRYDPLRELPRFQRLLEQPDKVF